MSSCPSPYHHVVLVDLDGVLLRGDAFTSLIVRALRRRPWRLVPAAGLVAHRLVTARHSPRQLALNRRLVRLALTGTRAEDFTHLAQETGGQLAAGPGPEPVMINEIRDHLAVGSRVIVVTASEHTVARAYLDAIGLREAELIASEVTFTADHLGSISRYNVGMAKVRAVEDIGVELSECLFYTDSASDLPLITRVGACVLVNPSRGTRRAVAAANLPAANLPSANLTVTTRVLGRRRGRPGEP